MTDPRDKRGTDAREQIDEAIGMEARQMQLRLPDEGESFTAEQRAAVIAAVKAHLKRYTLNQKELASAINYESSTVSQVLTDSYKGKTDAILRAMAGFIEDDVRRRTGAKPMGFYETSIFVAIRSLATYAKSNAISKQELDNRSVVAERPRIVVGFGPAGIGKSVGARAYCMEDPRAIYVRVRGGATRVATFTRDIVNAMSTRHAARARSAAEKCYDSLRGSQRLLIVDEGHRLTFAMAEFLRDLSDVCGIPVMILCTQEFYERLSRVRRREGNFNYDQFTSRVGYVVDLLRHSDGKGGVKRPFYSLNEIRAIFRSDKVRLSADGAEYLQAIACTPGSGMLRTCSTVFDKALRSAVRKGIAISMSLLESSVDASMVPAGLSDDEFVRNIRETLARNRRLNEDATESRAAG